MPTLLINSPLEQFEPIPLLVIFFGGIDLSITNVTIIFIYIVLVLCYFLTGYFINLQEIRLINLVRPKGNLVIKNRQDYNESDYNETFFFNNSYSPVFGTTITLFANKTYSFLNYLITIYTLRYSIEAEKLTQVSREGEITNFTIEDETFVEFHNIFFNILKTKSSSMGDINVNFFNGVKLYVKGFIANFYAGASKLASYNIEDSYKAFNFLYFLSTKKSFSQKFIANYNIYLFENIYNVILGMVKENISGNLKESIKFFPFIFSLFIFILISNLIGLIPYSSTVTSYLIITFAMAIMVLVGVNIIAGRLHGFLYFGHFLPSGCPFALYPLIIPIEFISYVFRVVSLSVRLFANMMAGHTLLAVLAGFGWTMVNTNINLVFYHPLPIFVVFVLVFLESAVAIIQAYVFAILSCMYLDEAINLH